MFRSALGALAAALLASVMGSSPAAATPAEVDGLTYVLSGSTAEVTGCAASRCSNLPIVSGSRTITIPPTINVSSQTYTVTSIGQDAFSSADAQMAIIGDNVVTIGFSAFGSARITGVALGHAVETIDQYAFFNTLLSGTVSFGAALRSLAPDAFALTGISAYQVDPHNTTMSAVDGVIVSPASSPTTVVAYPPAGASSYIVPAGITKISTRAFSQTAVTTVSLPTSLREIESGAFEFSPLTHLALNDGLTTLRNGSLANTSLGGTFAIPSSVTFIAPGVFADTDISAFTTSPANATYSEVDGVLYEEGGGNANAVLRACPPGRVAPLVVAVGTASIGTRACAGNRLTEVYLPDSVTAIEDSAFEASASLVFAAFAGSAPAIGANAFSGVAGTFRTYASPNATGFPAGGLPHTAFAVTSAVPSSGLVAGSALSITGAGFGTLAAVRVGGTDASMTRTSEGILAATAPAGSGTVDLQVVMPAGILAGRTSVTYQTGSSSTGGSSSSGAPAATTEAPTPGAPPSMPAADVGRLPQSSLAALPPSCGSAMLAVRQMRLTTVASLRTPGGSVRVAGGRGLRVTRLNPQTRYCISSPGASPVVLGWAISDQAGSVILRTPSMTNGRARLLAFTSQAGDAGIRYIRIAPGRG